MNDPKRIAIVLLCFITLGLCAFGIQGHMDSDGYKNEVNYTTAIQTTSATDFNYSVDTQQGRVLTNGKFTADSKLAQFPEMNKGFTYVKRTKEHYTPHTSCSKHSCHTYYTWDEVGSEDSYASKVTLFGRKYPSTLFNFSNFSNSTDACSFTQKDTSNGWFSSKNGCSDGDYYLDNDDRYVYDTVPTSFTATFLATTYGGLKPFNEDAITLQDKSVAKVLHDVGQYQIIGVWVLIIILIILTGVSAFIAYDWVMEDGVWSLNR